MKCLSFEKEKKVHCSVFIFLIYKNICLKLMNLLVNNMYLSHCTKEKISLFSFCLLRTLDSKPIRHFFAFNALSNLMGEGGGILLATQGNFREYEVKVTYASFKEIMWWENHIAWVTGNYLPVFSFSFQVKECIVYDLVFFKWRPSLY